MAKKVPQNSEKAKVSLPKGFASRAGLDSYWYMIREPGSCIQGKYLGRFPRTTKGITKDSFIHQVQLTAESAHVQQITSDGEVILPDGALLPTEIVNIWETHQIRKELTGVKPGTEIFIAVEEKKILPNGSTFWKHLIAVREEEENIF